MEKENQNKEEVLKKDKISIWKIDKQMLPYKVHFFLYAGAMGALLPYHPSIGITRLNLGAGNLTVVFTVQQFLYIIFKPIIGYAADYFNNLKTMIVTLTVINGILSYLLLAIPKIDNNHFIDFNNHSQLIHQPSHTIFCKFCSISDELNTMIEYLPVVTEKNQDEIPCSQENNVSERFVGYCPKNSNFSITYNIKLEIKINTCYVTKYILKQSANINRNSQNNKSSTIFIKMHSYKNSSELDIFCPNIKNLLRFQISNFTLHNITKSCFRYPIDKILTNNAAFEKYTKVANNVICDETELKEHGEYTEFNSFKTYQFWLYTLFLVIASTCTSAIFTLSDTACYETVQITGADYGKQRAWGAIGWGLFAPFSGYLNDYTDDYWAAVILMSVLCALQVWNLTKINFVKPQYSQSILKDIKTVLSSAEFIAFEVSVFLNGIGIGIVWFFLAWFITDIGGSRLLIGLAHTVQCFLGEMPFMVLSGWFIRKVGHFNVVSMALLAHAVRFIAYSSLKDPWMILPIECLDGITFGLFYTAMTSYGKINAKPGTEATTQALLCSTYKGLGAGIGCVIGGACFDYFGGYTTFFYAGLCFAVASGINITSTALLHFKKTSTESSTKTSNVTICS